ncbi:MAG: acetate--CoA ligase [Coriobacteriia bacterium]|nr:acetate--CoA ligase [Coriobacteriia bacterium]
MRGVIIKDPNLQSSNQDQVEESILFAEPTEYVSELSWINSLDTYKEMYQRSIEDPEGFWAEQAEEFLYWKEPWSKVLEWDFEDPHFSWFVGGKTNVSYNCIDRHLHDGRRNKAAFIWESDERHSKVYTYQSLYTRVCRLSNVLKSYGIGKGDVVAIFLPMVPEIVFAMLACARIGAIHTIIFSGFSAEALRDRLQQSHAKVLITADSGLRGGRINPLKNMADAALLECPEIQKVIVVSRLQQRINMEPGRDVYYHEEVARKDIKRHCDIEWVDAEHPLFILYTSGSTGRPKGVVHTTGGYLLGTSITFKYIFDTHEDDVYFCTADAGWITGHSYLVYGPLSLGVTSVLFEGVPTYPDAGRFWDIIERHGVNQFYTAPTAIRSLMRHGSELPLSYDLSSLRVLGSVGEPINPAAWKWFYRVVGKERCSIADTWWQTETGMHMITTLPGIMTMKSSAAGLPFFGVQPIVITSEQKEAEIGEDGHLCMKYPWPSIARGFWDEVDNTRFKETYFSPFPGYYFTGDAAMKDEDGYYWLKGRVDDMLNVSGHRLGTAEIEAALNSSPDVAESAVVSFPHDIKGEGIYAYIVLKDGIVASDDLPARLSGLIRLKIGPIARPDVIHVVDELPKTRSGKLMRRILRKIASGTTDIKELGDLSTLVDEDVVEMIIKSRPKVSSSGD